MSNSFKRYASEQYVDEQLSKIHLDWESIQNKPFGTEPVLYEWDDDIEYEGLQSIEPTMYFEKISDDTPTMDFFINKYIRVKGMIDGVFHDGKILIEEDSILGTEENGGFTVSDFFVVALQDSFRFNNVVFSSGIWVAYSERLIIDLSKIQLLGQPTPIEETLLPTTAQSDWNENDSTKFSYIKNKPFGVDMSSFEELLDISSTTWQNASGAYLTQLNGLAFPWAVGDNGAVIIDGTMYSGVVEDLSHIQSGFLGFGDTAGLAAQDINQINFLCYAVGTITLIMIRTDTMPTECKLGTGTEIIKKIDEKYLPDGTKITTKTPIALYEWDEDVVYSDIVNAPTDVEFSSFAKISDNVISQDEFIGKTVAMKILYNDQEVVESAPITSNLITSLGDSAYSVAEMIWVVSSDSCEISFGETSVTLTKGVWCANDMI